MDDDLTIAYMTGVEAGKDAAKAEIERLRAQLAERDLELRKANIKLRDRAHPASEPRDPPEVLASIGFWPDCGCGECYAIHCLGDALAQLAERDRDAERMFDAGWRTAANWMERDDLMADMDSPAFLADRKSAIDAAMAKAER